MYLIQYIDESAKVKKKYKCPYCELRDNKERLIRHVERSHDDMIPEGFTPARVVFNTINKKETGYCTVCKREAPWNEDKCRYDRQCGRKECKIAYKKQTEARIYQKYGKDSRALLLDPEQQQKMLANRKISGTYKWSDGNLKTYTGSYEKKCLEYFDKVLNASSVDVLAPGPVLEYDFEDKKHIWITDIYYAPYNLVIECKDGGDNPNNRSMPSYRAKQIKKEEALTRQGNYNYLRLTNNNFEQLFLILAELKMQLIDNYSSQDKVIRINENMMPGMMGFMPPAGASDVYVINYSKRNTFVDDVAVSKDYKLDSIFVQDDDGVIKEYDHSFLEDCNYSIYLYKDKKDNYKKIIESFSNKSENAPDYIYETLFDKKMYTKDQILFENMKPVIDFYSYMDAIKKITEATIRNPEINIEGTGSIETIDENGYYLVNLSTGLRTESKNKPIYNSLERLIIERGIL